MEDTSLSSSIFSNRDEDQASKYVQKIQNQESEIYNLTAQLKNLMGLTSVDAQERIKELCLEVDKKDKLIVQLNVTTERKTERFNVQIREKDNLIKNLERDLLRLRDENAELKQRNHEFEDAKQQDESLMYRNLINKESQSQDPSFRQPKSIQIRRSPDETSDGKADDGYQIYSSTAKGNYEASLAFDDLQSVCSDTNETRGVHISIDAELTIQNTRALHNILNRTNTAQFNVKGYKEQLFAWKENMNVLFDQLKQTANFLGRIASLFNGHPEEKAQVQELLNRINGMQFTLNTSMNQTTEMMEGADAVENSLAELTGIIDDSLQRSMSVVERYRDAPNRTQPEKAEVAELKSRIVDLQRTVENYDQLAKVWDEKNIQLEQLAKENEKIPQLHEEIKEAKMFKTELEQLKKEREERQTTFPQEEFVELQEKLAEADGKVNTLEKNLKLRSDNLSEALEKYEELFKEMGEKDAEEQQLQKSIDLHKEALKRIIAKIPENYDISPNDELSVLVAKFKGFIEHHILIDGELRKVQDTLAHGNGILRQKLEFCARQQGVELSDVKDRLGHIYKTLTQVRDKSRPTK